VYRGGRHLTAGIDSFTHGPFVFTGRACVVAVNKWDTVSDNVPEGGAHDSRRSTHGSFVFTGRACVFAVNKRVTVSDNVPEGGAHDSRRSTHCSFVFTGRACVVAVNKWDAVSDNVPEGGHMTAGAPPTAPLYSQGARAWLL